MRILLTTFLVLFLGSLIPQGRAAEKEPVKLTGKQVLELGPGTRVNLNSPGLAVQLLAIKKEIEDGIIYSELSRTDLKYIKMTLESFAGWSSQNASPPLEITPEMLVAEKKVNQLLTQAQKDSVLVCRAEKVPGSHLVKRRCLTVAQAERVREKTLDNFLRRTESKVDAPIVGAPRGGP